LRFELSVLLCFVEQRPAYQVAIEYEISYQTVTRIFRDVRELLFHQCELEGKKLSGEIEIDEAYFGGKRKGKRGRAAAGKSVVLGLLERDGKVYTRIVQTLTAENLMSIIKKKTRKGSVYHTDTFKSYNSLHQFGKHLKVNHSKELVSARHNHINGIEGFWSYAKHKLYNYRGVSKANFPLYLKEMEYRYNHRKENILEPIMNLYFGYVSY
jgi:transposase